ncbi:sigma-70 family RNA polymerase sigma factor [Paenibacillus bovis]|nr:sigma-70 family RNA polymerase sigma factor [Paenibacillus bovis]
MRIAFLLVRDRQAAEEAVQDTFIQAYRRIGQLQDASKLKSWLIRIVINRCRMKQRTWSWRNIFPGGGAEELPDAELTGSAGADELVMKYIDQHHLVQAVQQLDYMYRECIVLYYFQEMSIQEIADQLKSKENTIKSRLARGRSQLRRLLEEDKQP